MERSYGGAKRSIGSPIFMEHRFGGWNWFTQIFWKNSPKAAGGPGQNIAKKLKFVACKYLISWEAGSPASLSSYLKKKPTPLLKNSGFRPKHPNKLNIQVPD